MTQYQNLPGLHEVRPEVAALARLMEMQLRKHDDRPGWTVGVRPSDAWKWLANEVNHPLARAVGDFECTREDVDRTAEIAQVGSKAANVANYALMVAATAGALEIPAGPTDLPEGEYDIAGWCAQMIEGGGGMNVYEERELATWPKGERIGAAEWIIRCLANPQCDGSAEVLQAIIRNRQYVANRGPAWADKLPSLVAKDTVFAGEYIAQIENAAHPDKPKVFSLSDVETAFYRWLDRGAPGTMTIILNNRTSTWTALAAQLGEPVTAPGPVGHVKIPPSLLRDLTDEERTLPPGSCAGLEEIDPMESLQDLLRLVDVEVPLEDIKAWPEETQEAVWDWAGAEYARAGDNIVKVPQRPAVLDGYQAPKEAPGS